MKIESIFLNDFLGSVRLHWSDHDEFRVPVYDNQIGFTSKLKKYQLQVYVMAVFAWLGIMVLSCWF